MIYETCAPWPHVSAEFALLALQGTWRPIARGLPLIFLHASLDLGLWHRASFDTPDRPRVCGDALRDFQSAQVSALFGFRRVVCAHNLDHHEFGAEPQPLSRNDRGSPTVAAGLQTVSGMHPGHCGRAPCSRGVFRDTLDQPTFAGSSPRASHGTRGSGVMRGGGLCIQGHHRFFGGLSPFFALSHPRAARRGKSRQGYTTVVRNNPSNIVHAAQVADRPVLPQVSQKRTHQPRRYSMRTEDAGSYDRHEQARADAQTNGVFGGCGYSVRRKNSRLWYSKSGRCRARFCLSYAIYYTRSTIDSQTMKAWGI